MLFFNELIATITTVCEKEINFLHVYIKYVFRKQKLLTLLVYNFES